MEGAGYAVGASDLCAACVGAPHPRQRLYWVANAKGNGLARASINGDLPRANGSTSEGNDDNHKSDDAREAHRLVQSDRARSQSRRETSKAAGHWNTALAASFWSASKEVEMYHPRTGERCKRRISAEPLFFPLADGLQTARVDALRGAGNAIVPQVGALFIEAARDSFR
jgi:DNA (cytosine-5)-methyltransferase 1